MGRVEWLKAELRKGLHYDPESRPAFDEMPVARVHERAGRGLYGEEILARTVDARGGLILDVGPGSEGVYHHGPDLVTLEEGPEGPQVKFYDNKAFATKETVYEVGALVKNFGDSRDGYLAKWDEIARSVDSTKAEQETFALAAELVREGRYSLVVTNANGKVTGISEKLMREHHVQFEDIAGEAIDVTTPAFDAPMELPPPKTQSAEKVVDVTVPAFDAPMELPSPKTQSGPVSPLGPSFTLEGRS